jgi:hypothetical protein
MTDAVTDITLEALHQAILLAISSQFPDLATVEDYRSDRSKLPTPACLIELVDLEGAPADNPGTEQLAVLARFSARLIIGGIPDTAEREIRRLSCALAAFTHRQRWGLPVGPAEVTTIAPDDFDPGMDRFVVWSIEWQQIVHLGDTVWTNDGVIPEVVLFSWEPETGVPNEPAYQPLIEPLP